MEKKRKKLLIYISNLEICGAQNMVFELASSLKEYEVFILVQSSKKGNWLEKRFEQLFHTKFLGFDGKQNLNIFIKSLKEINRINPDIIHCHLGIVTIGLFWSVLHRKKCVITVHTRPDKAFSKRNLFVIKRALKKRTNVLVAVSEQNYKLLIDYFGLLPNITYINNGINVLNYFKKDHDIFTFIHVARQDKNKNASFIIDCFNDFTLKGLNARLLLLGDGEEHDNLISLVKKYNLFDRIDILGNVNNVSEYYSISDCFLLASHREALPMTALEAIATKIPIISTNVGGMKDIGKGNGFLIEDNDKCAYLDSMVRVFKGELKKENVEQISERLIQSFTSEKMARQYTKIYEE